MSYANKKTGEVISNNDFKALTAKKRKDYKRFDQATNQIKQFNAGNAAPSASEQNASRVGENTPKPGSDWANK